MIRLAQFIRNKEWVMALAFLDAVLIGVDAAVDILPADAQGPIYAAVAIVTGLLARVKVYSQSAVDIMQGG
jgi:hypothetical protein